MRAGKGTLVPGSLLAAVLLAILGVGRPQSRVPDTLTVLKPGDTAKASQVNANFQVLWDRLDALSAQSAAQIRILNARIDSLGRHGGRGGGRIHADSVVGLDSLLAGKAPLDHVHPVSEVTELQDSLDARVVAKGGPMKVCSGKTAPGIGWVGYTAYSVYLEVDTKACGFTSVPRYYTSLGGTTNHYVTLGVTSIYAPTATGFKVYVANQPWAATPVAPLASWGLHVNWVAIGP